MDYELTLGLYNGVLVKYNLSQLTPKKVKYSKWVLLDGALVPKSGLIPLLQNKKLSKFVLEENLEDCEVVVEDQKYCALDAHYFEIAENYGGKTMLLIGKKTCLQLKINLKDMRGIKIACRMTAKKLGY